MATDDDAEEPRKVPHICTAAPLFNDGKPNAVRCLACEEMNKHYPYEVSDLLNGPVERSATSASIERCSCPQAERYKVALKRSIEETDCPRAIGLAQIALAAIEPA